MILNIINNNNITQVHNSKKLNTGPINISKYKSKKSNTLFWGMYNKNDIKLCLDHKGKRWIYWHYEDCNYNDKFSKNNVEKIKKLPNTTHLCNIKSAKFLDKFNINYNIILGKPSESYLMGNKYKLYYKINLLKNLIVSIFQDYTTINYLFYNNIFYHNNSQISNLNNYILKIFKNFDNNNYEIHLNNTLINTIYTYNDIKIINISNNYKASLNYSLSINNFDKNHLKNLNYFFENTKFSENIQYNICHIDSENYKHQFLDKIILNNDKINYIYCKKDNNLNFNLGFCRNLFIFLNLSNKIIFSDIDIPLPEFILKQIIDNLDIYDVVSPYKNNIYYTTLPQKNEWINNYKLNDNEYKLFCDIISEKYKGKKLFTISGGITGYKSKILEFLGGYSELNKYGGEDRYMDVNLIYFKTNLIRLNNKLFHLYHKPASIKNENKKINDNYNILYGCSYNKNAREDIHEYCNHNVKYLEYLRIQRQSTNFNLNLLTNNYNLNSLDLRNNILDKDHSYIYYGNIIITKKSSYFIIDQNIKFKNLSNIYFDMVNLDNFKLIKNCYIKDNKLYIDKTLEEIIEKILSKVDYRDKYLKKSEYVINHKNLIFKLSVKEIIENLFFKNYFNFCILI